jgi:hypothetical protein
MMMKNHDCCLVPELPHHHKWKPLHLLTITPHSLPPRSWQPQICILSLYICLFWIFQMNEIMEYLAVCVWLL